MAKHLKMEDKKPGRGLWIGVLIGSVVLLGIAAALLLPLLQKAPTDDSGLIRETTPMIAEPSTVAATVVSPEPSETVPVPDTAALTSNPVDWDYYTGINEDVYAWISVPGTDIELPVLQAHGDMDDNFYLHHDINGNYLFAGEVYSQKANAKDFSDRVTVLYGHNMKREGERFTNLLYFQDKEFFNEHEFFYIYTPGHILTYRIVSAHSFDTRHILNNYDFSSDEDFQEYLDTILSPRTMIANVREDAELTLYSRIVTLSTCTYVNGEKIRYLVQGVLYSDERTN